jgi:hypothetical protein
VRHKEGVSRFIMVMRGIAGMCESIRCKEESGEERKDVHFEGEEKVGEEEV